MITCYMYLNASFIGNKHNWIEVVLKLIEMQKEKYEIF